MYVLIINELSKEKAKDQAFIRGHSHSANVVGGGGRPLL